MSLRCYILANQVGYYWKLMNIKETGIHNVMDMNAFIGGFAVALNSMPVWVMNLVPMSMNNIPCQLFMTGVSWELFMIVVSHSQHIHVHMIYCMPTISSLTTKNMEKVAC